MMVRCTGSLIEISMTRCRNWPSLSHRAATANLNRQNVLLQSAISLLGLANQQSSQVLSLLR